MSAGLIAEAVSGPATVKPRALQDVADELFDVHAMLEALDGRIELHRTDGEGGIDYDAAGLLRRVVSVASRLVEGLASEVADWKSGGAA